MTVQGKQISEAARLFVAPDHSRTFDRHLKMISARAGRYFLGAKLCLSSEEDFQMIFSHFLCLDISPLFRVTLVLHYGGCEGTRKMFRVFQIRRQTHTITSDALVCGDSSRLFTRLCCLHFRNFCQHQRGDKEEFWSLFALSCGSAKVRVFPAENQKGSQRWMIQAMVTLGKVRGDVDI